MPQKTKQPRKKPGPAPDAGRARCRVAFLGPEGTFTHFMAQKRFGKKCELIPFPTVKAVFDHVRGNPGARGLAPIENSSGGTIYETVDGLIDGGPLYIEEALSLNVRLALLGREKNNVRAIYSHFAPLHHCQSWLEANHPRAERKIVASTARAAELAAKEKGAAAICNRAAAKRYNLKVLKFPIEQDVENLTQFIVFGHEKIIAPASEKTSLVAKLPNKPGSLVDFLEPFKRAGLNLSRIISRPVPGRMNTYVFLVDIQASEADSKLNKVLARVKERCVELRSVGSYPVRAPYRS